MELADRLHQDLELLRAQVPLLGLDKCVECVRHVREEGLDLGRHERDDHARHADAAIVPDGGRCRLHALKRLTQPGAVVGKQVDAGGRDDNAVRLVRSFRECPEHRRKQVIPGRVIRPEDWRR
jgi:hypothetical protein